MACWNIPLIYFDDHPPSKVTPICDLCSSHRVPLVTGMNDEALCSSRLGVTASP